MFFSLFDKNNRILLLSPHPDDEIGCGGLINKLVSRGFEVHHWFFSLCRESLKKKDFTPEMLLEECNASRQTLGIDLFNTGNFDIPVRYFPKYRQQILEYLVQLRDKVSPVLVLVPNSFDIHQDHHCLYEEAVRAFKHTSILGYELPWNTVRVKHDCFIEISENELFLKVKALKKYRTQVDKIYANDEFFRSLAVIRGVQSSLKFAECYEVIRLILS
jgi:LmbE family N-acetylglucosaminyl deacetylase